MTAPKQRVARKFVNLMGDSSGNTYAVADDGTAWRRVIGERRDWQPLPALPDREVPTDDDVPF